MWVNAGATGEPSALMNSSTGRKARTQIAIITAVTIEEVAIAIVEITSPSSLVGLTFALSIELRATGTLRFVTLPVTKPT